MEPVLNVFHLVEGFALVMLCNCRLYPRRLSVHILREVKTLIKSLGCCEDDQPVIDVMDRCCPQVMEKCLGMLPPAEKSAVLATSNIDLQWIADRSSCIWTAGICVCVCVYTIARPLVLSQGCFVSINSLQYLLCIGSCS